MQVVKIDGIKPVTAAFVALSFLANIGLDSAGQAVRGRMQVILPVMQAPGVGELAVYLPNTEQRPSWMKSPLLCYHGRGEAMGRPNDGGLFPCQEWQPDDPEQPSRYSLIFPRMSQDPLYQQYVQDGLDVTEFYLGGIWNGATA